MLSGEFQQFYTNWLGKADRYDTNNLHELFDRFFTLYVLYNRVYAEATFTLARNKSIDLAGRNSFPDSKAATDYVVQYLGANEIVREIESDQSTHEALTRVCSLIENEDFHIRLNMITGAARREKDLDLLASLRSPDSTLKAKAIVGTIYSIRCNTFHGHKQFVGVQRELLTPVSTILKKVIQLVYNKLCNER